MEIDIPPWLQWVSYLAGDTWPQGRATGMFRIDDFFHAAAEELDELIPDLNQVRGETLSVLFGETAQAADERFRTLFDGDYAVNKLSDAVRALGESAGFTGSEIEYSKLSIVVGLALAAAEISYSLSMSGPTGGASLGWIPPIEMFTMAAFRRWVVQAGGRVVGMLRSREGRAMVRREIRQEAWQELAIWGTQEGIVYKLQGDHYVPNSERLLLGAVASTVGGGAGGGTAVPVSAGLGSAGSKLGRAGKGMTTFFTAGIAGNIVGTAVTGNNPFANPLMIVTSSTTSSIGGARGAGVMPGSDGNRSPNGQLPPPEGGPPDGPPPDGPQPDDDTDDDSRSPATDPESTSANEPSDDGEGARVSTSPTDDSAAIPQAATQSNDVAPQADPEATPAATPSADSESDTDSPTTTETPATQPNGEAPQSDPSTEPATPTDGQGSLDSDGETSTGQPSTLSTDNGDLPAPDPETNTPVTDPAEHSTNNGQQPAEPAIADNTPSLTPQDGDQSKVEAAANIPTTSPDADTAPAAGQVGPPPASPTATPSSVGPSATPSAQTPNAQTPDARTPSAQTPTSSQRATPKTTPPQSSTDTPATKTPKPAAQQHVPDTPTAAASANESTVSPVAGISDAAATPAQNSTDQADTEQPTKAETEQPTKKDEAGPTLQHRIVIPSPRPGRSLNDCLQRVANRLSEKYGKPIRLLELPSARGTPARVLFQAVGSGSEFATYADVAEVLGGMDPGSSAILTSVWANGPRQGGHAYLAVNDSGRVYLEDPDTGERRPWPPPWGQDAVVRSAVAFLDDKGNATNPLHDTRQLVAAAAVGHVQGHPDSEVGPADPAQRWQHVPTQEDLANAALEERGLDPDEVHKLRHPLGVTEAARELGRYRAQDNAKWWNELTGEQQRALIDTYPQHIGNAEGIPADARDAANRLSLERDRSELQARRDRGERLTGQQRKQLARYDRIQAALDRSGNDAKKFGGPLLLAFDPFAFGGDGRAVVSFGHDPYKADSVSVHVPGRGMDIDQIGPTMGDAIKQLQSTLREDPDLKASSIAWIGYDTASGWKGLRAAGRSFARTGGAILCGDIQAFNAVRATPAAIHVFGHSYGSTTTSYAAEGGRLRGEVKTITLIGSPGAGPLKKAAQAGIGAENFFVASSSRDPATALGGRTRRAWGRIFGFGLGMDPAMEDFGAQRIAAEFSAEMDTPQTNRTHNAYYRYVDKTAGVRSESLANFGRIAAGKSVDIDPRRTVDERPWYRLGWRTVEPAEGRPLRLHDDTTGEHAGDRDTRRWWNPHWRAQSGQVEPPSFSPESPAASHLHDDVDGSHHDDSDDPGQRWKHVPTQEELANAALAARGLTPEQAHRLRNPLGLMEAACERAGDNRAWWNGLTGEQQRALIATYPQHIGNAEGIPAQARDVANRLALEQDRKDLQARRDRGERLTRPQRQQLARLDRVQAALDRAAEDAKDVGGPLLLAFDPFAFGGDGRAIVSLGHDPYKADSVSVHVPGVNMTIDELGPSMGFALNHLRSTLHENPDLNASSIVWLGYDTPRGPRQVASDRSARAGANILYSDIRAFNTVRDTPAAIHIFAHSYGSVTASYAGRDGRLANDIRSVSLIGSPGAGPLNSADEFGPEVDVYVASSSRDPIAALGGRSEGSRGRIFGRGMGIDPAMQSFGAQRITAEFSAGMDRWRRNMGTHNAYYSYVNRTAGVRSESLANFGRVAAGKPVDTEQHRTIRERPLRRPHIRTVEPAQGRPLQLADDTTGHHAGDRAKRRLWNPRWLSPIAPDGTPHTPDGDHPSEPHTPSSAELVKAALEARGVGPDGLVSPADHRVPQDVAVARAKANAKWWKGLSDPDSDGFSDVQLALIRAYPFQIGNAEGIPPLARHEANSIMLQRNLARRDVLVSRRENGVELNAKQERFIDLMNDIEAALASGKRNAGRAKVGGPYLLALDPQAFDGVGRAIVSFGADPYTAKSVSWYVPGMSTTIEKLRTMMLRGFNTLQSTLRENTDPDFTAASITYLGYKPPGSWDPQVGFQKMAREGGEIFASDMLAFNAGREIITGSPFSNHHVFAHSYGSSTVSHAGYGRRLAGQVKTITLIGSPGAGRLRHARDFGIGEENVFVASSSRDRTTGLGGERPGTRGRTISWMGQGIDPAMDFFGAQRITAEFPSALDQLRGGSRMTHSIYWAYMDPGLNPQVRSESLTNFGRIAAGRADLVDREGHRTLGERARLWRNPTETTIEPAIGRPLRIADDPHTHHPVNRRHYWNPRFLRLPAESIESGPVDVGPIDEDLPSPAELLAAPDMGDVEHGPVPDKFVADSALEARGVGPDGLVSPADHRVSQDVAVARAKANAKWWKGLSDPDSDGFSDVQLALIRAYPFQIGNAEGIPPLARHEANSIMLQRNLARRDVLVSRRENGVELNAKQERFIDLMNDIEAALASGKRNAGRAKVGGPYLLALDPQAFDGVGRAIVSFGADPYTAKSVSWYVPGMSTTIEKLRTMMLRGFNTLQSTLRENTDPDFTAASITYLGYKPPGSWDPQVGFQKMAREGGEIFASDMLAFNAGREIITGSPFSNHHVFAHSYGSSTVSHAGYGRRLAGQVKTITLIGSPGAGRLRHARDFGIGEENVFVASSSRDRTTGLGGERPGTRGRTISWMGQGIDPAMDFFGAQRITAEFPSALDQLRGGSRMTHSIYWAYMDPGLNPQVRSESLTNFGRIAAGRADLVDREGHRTLGERARLWRNPTETTIEPAIGRPLRIADDPHTHHPVNRRHYWNPRFLRDIDCGHGVIQELSAIFADEDVDFVLDVPPSPRGVPARNLFNAIRSRSEFATYAQIDRRLKKLGHGSTALLASRWRGRGQGGHAYLATNVHGKIRVFDPHDGEWSDWPPPWSEKSIRRTAVGYLKANGEPVDQYDGSTRDLAAASFIGRVQGRPDPDAVADALARRMPRVGVAELVSPLGWAELAAARAEMNATWWSGLSPEQRQELVKAHPYEIGNAEGIFPEHRNDANQRVLQGYRDHAAEYQARQDNGERLQDAERKFLDRVNRIDAALQEATAAAELVGLDPPLLLGFDPRDFGGNGRALISFGTDPSQAEMVSWHATRQSIEQLGTGLAPVLDQLVSTREETPTAAAIIWVGKEASKVRVPWDTSRKPGPDGVLNSDQAAFRGARAVWARTGTSELATVGDATESQVAVEEAPLTDTELTPVKPAYVHELSETEARALRIEEALAQRNPRVRPDELRNPVDMVDSNPADMADEASARARNNAAWWKGLTPDQRQDLIEAYPEHIGNAEGIPPKDRDAANQIVLEQLRDRRDRVLDKIHHFKPPSLEELRLLRRVNRLDRELRKASADAKRANVDGPLLLAFDPAEFGGDGRAVLSFGHDPYDADSVSVHVPGVGTTVNSRFFFGFYNSCALNHLLSTRQENPNLKAASIAWIGYDTPSGRKTARMRNQEVARAGGELLYSDIRALSEGRTTWNGSDGRTPRVHVFGYSYGSTTTAHAGVGGRLADYVSTVSLVGSPGAGPLQQASEFGLEDGNVFVASSSRDLVTGLGGRTEGSTSRILPAIARKLGLGLGIDPAMESFGAVRVTAEVPVAMNRPHILGTHDTYYQYANPDGDPRVRSEALANLGRIAADRTDRLHLERHRTEGDRRGLPRTVDPAAERSVHRFGNPAWLGADARRDPEFLQRQADYRAQDRTTRRVDTRYAQPLGDVVDNAGDMENARRLAEDLSGVYGPFRIRLQAERFGTEVRLTGVILNGDTEIGNIQRILDRGSDGKLVAYHTGVSIKEEFAHLRGHGFSKALTAELERYYVRSGVDRIEVWTHDKGANIWARRGFTWNPDPQKLQESLDKIKRAAETLSSQVSADARRALDEMVRRLEPDHPRLPEPIEIAHLSTADEPNLGRRLLESVGLRPDGGVHLVRYLPVETQLLTSQPRKGFRALLQRWFGLGADRGSTGDPDCGRGVVAVWARRYGRDVRVPIPRSRTGLPAWAVFESTGSGSRFATDDEVFAELQRLGPGSSAILASRWSGGRWGGHARFAVNDGGRIYVEECYNEQTSERLGWPPQGAVSQTAVGYFDSDGNPTHPLHDVPLQLAAADAIGDVKGLPEDPAFRRDHAQVSGSIVLHTQSTVAGITGPVQRSVTGLVTGLAPDSRTTPTVAIDDAGTPRLTASIVLHAVEVRGPTHVQLSEALGDPGLLRIDCDDLTVRCRVQYRIFDSGNIQATIVYADPALNHPNFDTVRRMIDAALQDRFPDKRIEIGEAYDYGDRTDFVDRELPPRVDQEEYRALDPATREVKTAYAERLGDVLGHSVSLARVRQLADDLSGDYGPYYRSPEDGGRRRHDHPRRYPPEWG